PRPASGMELLQHRDVSWKRTHLQEAPFPSIMLPNILYCTNPSCWEERLPSKQPTAY
uniref:Uncharacterized protein n=1 Tax=Castor canadensis TaxID=51338 RepID=A0A8C0ZW65_CASCN